MPKRIQTMLSRVPLLLIPLFAIPLFSVCIGVGLAHAQEETGIGLASPHGEGQYVGLTKCAACHFDQYKDWKGSEHNRAFEILPMKYRTDASCLECHATAAATDTTAHPFGVSCESCHGPGGEHAKYALRFVNEVITEEGLKNLRDKIQLVDMLQCVKCHVSKAHKKHPPYDREEVLPEPTSIENRSTSFFDSIHRRGPDAGSRSPAAQVGSLVKLNHRDAATLATEGAGTEAIGSRLVKEGQ